MILICAFPVGNVGLWSSLPYIESLLGEGVKVLVLAEYWLCGPFELNKLSEINDKFEVVGKAGVRLSENAQRSRDLGA